MNFDFVNEEADDLGRRREHDKQYRDSAQATRDKQRRFLGDQWSTIRAGIEEACTRFNRTTKKNHLEFESVDIDRADFCVTSVGQRVECWLDRTNLCICCSYRGETKKFQVMISDVPVFVHDFNLSIAPEEIVKYVVTMGTKAVL